MTTTTTPIDANEVDYSFDPSLTYAAYLETRSAFPATDDVHRSMQRDGSDELRRQWQGYVRAREIAVQWLFLNETERAECLQAAPQSVLDFHAHYLRSYPDLFAPIESWFEVNKDPQFLYKEFADYQETHFYHASGWAAQRSATARQGFLDTLDEQERSIFLKLQAAHPEYFAGGRWDPVGALVNELAKIIKDCGERWAFMGSDDEINDSNGRSIGYKWIDLTDAQQAEVLSRLTTQQRAVLDDMMKVCRVAFSGRTVEVRRD